MTIQAINPTTGETTRYEEHSDREIEAKLHQADSAFSEWRATSFAQRSQALMAVARGLRNGRDELASLITSEMGKPIGEAKAEIDKCGLVCEYYADHAASFLAHESAATDPARSYVRFDPLGPILAVMPWNFPFWQVFRFAAPSLMAGNVCVIKHASNVPGCAAAIEEVFQTDVIPTGAVSALRLEGQRVAELVGHSAIKAVTLTGSERAGRAIAAEAGKHLKKCVLELGGSDPFLVLADADLPRVVGQAVKARTINSGQSCIAAKRFIVEDKAADAFTAGLVASMQELKVGDPRSPETDIGPLARHDLRTTLHEQVTRSVDAGAIVLCGGVVPSDNDCFYPPTVLGDVQPGMPAFDEETFGPVAAVIRARDVAHAVELANRSRFGLAASVWTADVEQGERLASQLDCGCVFVNEIVKSDPRVPFGGIKCSGYGRELGCFGIREFTNIKTVWLNAFDVVQEASEESFPASDPPAWTPVTKS